MATTYATPAEVNAYAGVTVTNPVIIRASLLVTAALRGSVYATDADGLPTEPAIKAACRDAVCAQIAYWDETGDTTGMGAMSDIASASILGVSIAKASGAQNDGKGSGYTLCAAALLHLSEVGLPRPEVVLRG